MSLSWQDIKKASNELSVVERLELIDAIVKSVTEEVKLNPPPQTPKQSRAEFKELLKKKGIEYREVEGVPILTPRQLLDAIEEDIEKAD
ncbi:MAG TPA: hypothetical protein V6D28_07865 [Leptolyngbyaceae cyanobacterium]